MSGESAASRLKERVTLQQPVMTPDGAGGYDKSWEDVAEIWAAIAQHPTREPAERYLDGQLQARVTYRVLIRSREADATMRLLWRGKALNIRSAVVSKEEGLLEILAEEGVAA